MDINSFMEKVLKTGALTNDSYSSNRDLLCELVNEKVNNIQIQEWLKEIVSNNKSSDFAHLASLMEIHPLGFQKYVLWDQGVRVRLHFWDEKSTKVENIHDHRFHFCAKIISGSYTHEVYDIIEPLKENEKVDIRLVSKQNLVAGNTYFFPAGVFHRIIQNNEKTISFLIRGEAILPYTRIIDSNTMKVRRKMGTVDTFLNGIKSLIKEL